MVRERIRKSWLLLAVIVVGAMWSAAVADSQPIDESERPYPVLLVHGLASDPSSWKELPRLLENRGFEVFVMDFNDWNWLPYASRGRRNFNELSAALARQIAEIRQATGRPQVNIIAHSIGGIIVRGYIAGWGARLETRGRYKSDVARVIYLSTPHYGMDLRTTTFRQLLRDTDYGDFMHMANLMSALRIGSSELLELHDFFRENGESLGIEELTVSSKKDHVVQVCSANLDGEVHDPFVEGAASVTAAESNHVHLQNYLHAFSGLLGSSKRTIIRVGSKSHPVYGIANSFLRGQTSWHKFRTNIKRSANLMILRFANVAGFDPRNLNVNNVTMKRVMPKRAKKVKLKINPNSRIFYVQGIQSGRYSLIFPFREDNERTYEFVIEVAEAAGTTVDFNPANPPLEPEGGNDDLPAEVTDLETLRQFVIARFPRKAYEQQSASGMLALVGNVRNTLASTYSNIGGRGVTPPDIFSIGGETWIDFVRDSDSGGIILDKLQWVECDGPDDGGGGGGGGYDGEYPENPPADVTNIETLREFVLWYLGDEAFVYQSHSMDNICKRVRDALVARYSNLYLPWSNSATKHFDAFRRRDNGKTVDFCAAKSAPGVLWNKLQWLEYTPLS